LASKRVSVAAVLIALPCFPARAQEPKEPRQTQIIVVYNGTQDEVGSHIEANQTFHHEYAITLSARNHVVENHVWRGGLNERTDTIGNHAHEGDERKVWHILPGNRIVRIGEFSQSFEVVDVTDRATNAPLLSALR